MNLLLSHTVMARSSHVRLTAGDAKGRLVLSGPNGPGDPLLLDDNRYLRLTITLFFETAKGERHLKVFESSYQYQTDTGAEIFRYDYLRNPKTHYPASHLQIHGRLNQTSVPNSHYLNKVHFPTGRIPLEAVIRLLAEQFGVHCHAAKSAWRPILTESESAFAQIAHRPLSGPSN
jgi:hypothetical protein